MSKVCLVKPAVLFILIFSSITPQPALAHGTGLIPFFRINNIYPTEFGLYKFRPSSNFFTIPQDLAPQNYLINQSLNFLIDKNQLRQALTSDTVDNMTFSWDFGDGQIGSGLENTHTYAKPGSYIISIVADYHNLVAGKQLVESVLINILPNKIYQLPNVQILVDGDSVKNPNNDVLEINLSQPLNFTISSNPAPTVLWDLGDNTQANTQSFQHTYNLIAGSVTPIVLVKDGNGFTSYGWIDLVNSQNQSGVESEFRADQRSKQKNLVYLIGSLAIIIVITMIILIARKKSRNKT